MKKLSTEKPPSLLNGTGRETLNIFESIDVLNDAGRAALTENGIKSLDALADLSSDDLLDIIGAANMSRETADQVIMAARAHWFEERE